VSGIRDAKIPSTTIRLGYRGNWPEIAAIREARERNEMRNRERGE
jgi:hypothetical protein